LLVFTAQVALPTVADLEAFILSLPVPRIIFPPLPQVHGGRERRRELAKLKATGGRELVETIFLLHGIAWFPAIA